MTATATFIHQVNQQINDAILIGGSRGKKIVRQLADLIDKRDIAQISSVDPADVQLTDEQWQKLGREARMQAAFCDESW